MSATPLLSFHYQHVEYHSQGAIIHSEQHYHHSTTKFPLEQVHQYFLETIKSNKLVVLFFNDLIFKETKFKHLLCTEDLTINNVFFFSVLYTSGFPNSTCEYLFTTLF